MGTEVPYTATGRTRQKSRTQQLLVQAAQGLLADGVEATVEAAAERAGVSRTTAYRYFTNQRQLLVAAYPQVDHESLLPDHPPTDVHERLDLVLTGFLAITMGWEAQLRAALRVSLDPGRDRSAPLREGRAIGWVEEALEPLATTHPQLDRHALAIAIRSATGIESYVWLVDVAGLEPHDAADVIRANGHALLRAATLVLPPRAGRTEKAG